MNNCLYCNKIFKKKRAFCTMKCAIKYRNFREVKILSMQLQQGFTYDLVDIVI